MTKNGRDCLLSETTGILPGYGLDDLGGSILDVGQDAFRSSLEDVQEAAARLVRIVDAFFFFFSPDGNGYV